VRPSILFRHRMEEDHLHQLEMPRYPKDKVLNHFHWKYANHKRQKDK
jgi:hypothetical protein